MASNDVTKSSSALGTQESEVDHAVHCLIYAPTTEKIQLEEDGLPLIPLKAIVLVSIVPFTQSMPLPYPLNNMPHNHNTLSH